MGGEVVGGGGDDAMIAWSWCSRKGQIEERWLAGIKCVLLSLWGERTFSSNIRVHDDAVTSGCPSSYPETYQGLVLAFGACD